MSPFQSDRFLSHAPEWVGKFHYHAELESTNDEVLRLGAGGAAHGTLVLAEKQTKGRGRRGASWLSEPGAGLMFSILLKPDFDRENWGRMALVAGLGIAEVLRKNYGVDSQIKWPNDVIVGGRKCCGILVESQEGFAVLGVGINVLGAPEGCAFVGESSDEKPGREVLLADLIKAIMREVGECAASFQSQIDRINARHYLTGHRVAFESGNTRYEGEVLRVSSDGSLCVRIGEDVIAFPQASNIHTL